MPPVLAGGEAAAPSRVITSSRHARIAQIHALRWREERDQRGCFYGEGLRFVACAVAQHAHIETLVVCPALLIHSYGRWLVALLRRQGVPVLEVSAAVLEAISLTGNRHGIAAVVRQRWESLDQVSTQGELCWLALERIQSPGNLGSILRTSQAAGGAGVILLGEAIDPYDPAAVRASMGAALVQRYVRATPDQFSRWAREQGWTLVGTSPAAPQAYHQVAYPSPLVLLLGWERRGLSRELQRRCDALVRIPMLGDGDSLNVAVAAGIILYELAQQRRGRPAAGAALPATTDC